MEETKEELSKQIKRIDKGKITELILKSTKLLKPLTVANLLN